MANGVTAPRLLAVRHAPVDARGLCYGQHDVLVLVDAETAGSRVTAQLSTPPAQVVSSPWARARDLGAAIARATGAPHAIDARVAEISLGAWEGRAFADLERDDGPRFARWMREWRTEATPGGETLADLEARVADWLASLSSAPAGPVLLVAHAGPIRALRRLLRPASWDEVMAEAVLHLVVETLEPRRPRVVPE
jgi:alpha-ribazole phosphatase